MLNILSYVGMSLQSELCLWTMLGLLRTIFDATLFKVNANLKQVWQMSMPSELTMSVQRVLRTMISGVMLVQCFTVYVYLATYIVLLYPVFLEERPTLVLPWLLLAAIRKFLCELTSLALGLLACVLLGPARPPCIKFVVVKVATITPAFYMWMLVLSYYHALKFKTFTAVLPSGDPDYGLELAVRRRRTKSLFGEHQLRKKLVATFNYGSRQSMESTFLKSDITSRMVHSTDTNLEEDSKEHVDIFQPLSVNSERILSDISSYEDWYGNEVILPRDADRILEQFVLMLQRISSYLQAEELTDPAKLFSSHSRGAPLNSPDCTVPGEDTDTPPQVGNSRKNTASYLQEYPHIFMKKTDTLQFQEQNLGSLNTVHNIIETDEQVSQIKSHSQRVVYISPSATIDNVNDRTKTIGGVVPIKESASFTYLPVFSKKAKSGKEFHSNKKDTNNKNNIENEEPEFSNKSSPEDSVKLSKTKQNQHSPNVKNTDTHKEKAESDNNSKESEESLQIIINRMKKSLYENKKTLKHEHNQTQKDCPTTHTINNTNSKNIVLRTKKENNNDSKDCNSSKTYSSTDTINNTSSKNIVLGTKKEYNSDSKESNSSKTYSSTDTINNTNSKNIVLGTKKEYDKASSDSKDTNLSKTDSDTTRIKNTR